MVFKYLLIRKGLLHVFLRTYADFIVTRRAYIMSYVLSTLNLRSLFFLLSVPVAFVTPVYLYSPSFPTHLIGVRRIPSLIFVHSHLANSIVPSLCATRNVVCG